MLAETAQHITQFVVTVRDDDEALAFYTHTLGFERLEFGRERAALLGRGVVFVRGPVDEPYGIVGVFADLYGNRFDLIERKGASSGNSTSETR